MLLDWAIHISQMQKRLSHSYQSKHHMCFTIFLWLRITTVALVLQLIWYHSTSWVSNMSDLVLVLIFWLAIFKCRWFFMLGIIASNFLKIGNGWAIVVKNMLKLFGLLSSHADCLRVNQIVFIMIEIPMTLGGEIDWCTLKILHLC